MKPLLTISAIIVAPIGLGILCSILWRLSKLDWMIGCWSVNEVERAVEKLKERMERL